MERDFEKDKALSKYHIDTASEQQAFIYHYWSEELTIAKDKLEARKDKLDLLLAQTELKYRAMDKLPGDMKATEGAIKVFVSTDEEVVKAKEKVRNSRREVNTLQSAVTSLEHKKYQIDNLTKLYLGNYFTIPAGGSKQDASTKDINKKLNKKGAN